jgi:glucose/arabinose dehydrogenase
VGRTSSRTPLDLPRQRIRALVPDPTGALYMAVDAGEIWRVAPRAP